MSEPEMLSSMARTYPGPPRTSLAKKFDTKYIPEPNTGCWLWLSTITSGGYGAVRGEKRGQGWLRAHRVAYELYREPIPADRELDHLCRVRCCVNPWHLEPVTRQVNVLRGMHANVVARRSGICARGHAMTVDPYRTGRLRCEICYHAARRAQRARRGRR